MVDADVSPELREALRGLEDRLGRTVTDVNDGHARWELYRAALASDAARPGLLAAVVAESDGALASGVVGEALERVPRADRNIWVEALSPAVRAFSERRARELGLLEDLRAGAAAPAPDSGSVMRLERLAPAADRRRGVRRGGPPAPGRVGPHQAHQARGGRGTRLTHPYDTNDGLLALSGGEAVA